MSKERTKYSKEFKIEAVRLAQDDDVTIKSVAEDLGVNYHNLCRWKRKYEERKEKAFPGNGNKYVENEEVEKLKKENARLKIEREILKKTLSIVN